MAGEQRVLERGTDYARVGIGVLALVFVPVAALSEPSRWWFVLALVAGALGVVVWAFLGVPAQAVAVPVVLLVSISQAESRLEPGLFVLCLLAIALTGWSDLNVTTVLLVLLTAAAPVIVAMLQDEHGISGGVWVMGVVFPALMGWAFHRQEKMAAELDAARMALAEQAVLEERRRIARDVHDLVGHGLAAMMLQITGARHVLDRDVEEVREALTSAEDIGRRTLGDLRRTVGSLRDEGGLQAPIEGLGQVSGLVDDARSSGLRVELVTSGPQDEVDQAVGLTLFRIAQAALANAVIHAPAARTVVTSAVTSDDATLEVLSAGPLRPRDPHEVRGHYGLRGMQERAEVVGGEFSAGPVPQGWLVRCRVAR
ncbi:histidine kinase [Ornithinimicrobium faecis]|uniref:histidine kinase n=1 Tax=Ornithinimicrobium faecis TaxID=2934158 RepID=A0ABY4YX82_9MICO|nr:histidine kinase [Ornithinimicrobium sp. HY1793]USQ81344.1 histidine kinase [Ornithinimicrobium sp. HY1793]